jgi:formate hydrogenlyase subunit 3/multisubunit Na+/H+ antiporter MnhD subunit
MSDAIDAFGLILVPALPILMMLAWCVPPWRCRIECWTPWAAVPPLMLALGGGDASVQLDWIIFGSVLVLDDTSRLFLGFSSLLWLGAGIYARDTLRGDERASAFRLLWLATMSGNYGLILSADVASFYAAFALMTFAGYGLVIHTRSPEALRAGRIYLIMAVIGEGLMIAGLLLAASRLASPLMPLLAELPGAIAGSPHRDLTIGLLLAGFGVKAGLPLLHMWLPLAHPVAPIPASAVLSGAMIKAGLLGWMQTLPLGLVALGNWSTALIGAGLFAAIGAALTGINQAKPKTVLAYSSVSQMGLMTVGVGIGFGAPEIWPLMAGVVTLYALHHGLAKGALFLGTGLAGPAANPLVSRLLWLSLALPAMSLAGLMFSGAAAKSALKNVLDAAGPVAEWWPMLPALLGLTAVGTTLLMARWLHLMSDHERDPDTTRDAWLGWGLVTAASTVGVLAIPLVTDALPGVDKLPGLMWPVIVGGILTLLAASRLRPLAIPAGDLVVPMEGLLIRLGRGLRGASANVERRRKKGLPEKRQVTDEHRHGVHLEQGLRGNAGLIFALLLAAVLAVMLLC